MGARRNGQLTEKQESFCLAYMETGNASEAYRRSYRAENCTPASVNRLACALLDNVKITSRLAELKAEKERKSTVTVAEIRENMREAVRIAQEKGDATALTNASKALAQLEGLWVDRKESTNTNHNYSHKDNKPDFNAIMDKIQRPSNLSH